MKTIGSFAFAALLVTIIAMTSLECRAETFIVTHNTAPLIGSVAGPFSLNFQFNGTAGNTATLSNFDFFGGAWTGASSLIGGTSVDGSGAVTLTSAPSSFFNAFTAGFTPGTTLRFLLTLTGNASPTPDLFSFAILDSEGFELPTFGGASEFLSIDVTDPLTIQTFAGDPNGVGPVLAAPVVVSVTSVPEPTAMMLFGSGLMLIAARIRKQRRP